MESISISTFNTGRVAFGGFLVENKGSKKKNVGGREGGRRAATKCPKGTYRDTWVMAGTHKGTRICA
jgi:hypothetical protein